MFDTFNMTARQAVAKVQRTKDVATLEAVRQHEEAHPDFKGKGRKTVLDAIDARIAELNVPADKKPWSESMWGDHANYECNSCEYKTLDLHAIRRHAEQHTADEATAVTEAVEASAPAATDTTVNPEN